MKDARCTAAQALMRQYSANAYSNLVIEPLIAKNRLSPRDAAFASALFYTALERMLTLDHILRKYCSRPPERLDQTVRAALQLGLCQLLYMDGVDDYAAVNESVSLTKALGAARASGMVNGVLRSFLRDGKEIPPVRGGKAEQLVVEYSCPAWLIERWLSAYGEETALRMLAGSLGRPPLYLRANTVKTTARALAARLEAEGVRAIPEPAPEGCLLAEGKFAVETLPAYRDGLFHVQDKASQFTAAALGALPGERVLDLCAAPGGKTFTIAELMGNQGEVVARDLHEKRARLVAGGAKRLGLTIVSASAGDAAVFDETLGSFDRVLCDVPCSGFGIIRRKPEIKYKPMESIQNLPGIQYKILQTAAHYLKAGGTLVYSTCTLLPEENERVVALFCGEHPDFSLENQETYTGETVDTDGFFVSVLRKR